MKINVSAYLNILHRLLLELYQEHYYMVLYDQRYFEEYLFWRRTKFEEVAYSWCQNQTVIILFLWLGSPW